jgi:16S rRNA (cytosine967-C5)-methyltransferase
MINPTRLEAVKIIERVLHHDAFADMLLAKVEGENWSLTRLNFLRQLVKGVLQNLGTIDEKLNSLLRNGIKSLMPQCQAILRLATYEILYMESIPNEVATNEAVELTKHFKMQHSSSLVNGVLRNLVRAKSAGVKDNPKKTDNGKLKSRWEHPQWMVERWIERYGETETEKLCGGNNKPLPLYLVHNKLKCSVDQFIDFFTEAGFQLIPSVKFTGVFVVAGGNTLITQTDAYKNGWFLIQDESQAGVVRLLDPQPDEVLLDLCSAPGGKAIHAAILMSDRGSIIAVDQAVNKLRNITDLAVRLDINIVKTRVGDGRLLQLENQVDKVLVDAPCSGFGILGRKADARWRKTPDLFNKLTPLQLELLENGAKQLKSGGKLVYSTCSTEPEENEEIIRSFLNSNSDFYLEIPNEMVFKELYSDSTIKEDGYYRTFPYLHQTGGGFATVLRKK